MRAGEGRLLEAKADLAFGRCGPLLLPEAAKTFVGVIASQDWFTGQTAHASKSRGSRYFDQIIAPQSRPTPHLRADIFRRLG